MSLPETHRIRLVCSDIDGTLVSGQTMLPEPVRAAIRTLTAHGISFAFATGRLPYEVEPLLHGLPEGIAYTAGNGTMIVRGGKTLETHSFLAAPLRQTAERWAGQGITVIFSVDGLERPLTLTPWARENASVFRGLDCPVDDSIWQTPLERMFFYHPQAGYLTQCRQELCAFEAQYEICSQNEYSIQISPRGCTKASGAAHLAELIGVSREEVLCIGDAQNDISMLRYAGIGVAVQNASAELKACADYVTEHAYGEGLVEIVDNSQFQARFFGETFT